MNGMLKKSKLFALLIAIMMVFMVFSACSSKQPAAKSTPGVSASTAETALATPQATPQPAVDPMAIYNPPITITTVVRTIQGAKFADGHSYDNTVWTPLYAKMGINIKILWQEDASQYENKLNMSVASGEIPDISYVYDPQLNTMVKSDMLMDMKGVLDQYMLPLTKKILYANNGEYMKAGEFNGKQLSIPTDISQKADYVESLWIRADWLKNVGLTAPKTVDDFMKICEAFTNGDPDKNGKKDTFALGVAGKDNLIKDWGGLRGIFLMYDCMPGVWFNNVLFYEKDSTGNVIWSGSKPQVKEALTTLQTMYQKGYIAKDFGTVDAGGKLVEDIVGEKCGMFFGSWWMPYWPLQDLKIKNPNSEWVVVTPPTYNDKPSKVLAYESASAWYAVSKECKYPEAIVKMLNLQIEKSFGASAEVIYAVQDSNDGGKSYNSAVIRVLSPKGIENDYHAVSNAIATKDTSKLNFGQQTIYGDILKYITDPKYMTGWSNHEIYGGAPGSVLKLTYDEITDDRVQNNLYWAVLSDTMSSKLPTYKKMAEETITKIVYGQSPVNDWDKMMADWNKLGGEQILSEVAAKVAAK